MSIEVVMPQMGQSVAEGTIMQWFKEEGDRVEKDEALLVINTDKIDVEVPSPEAGRLSRILVHAGETVPVLTPLAYIDVGGTDHLITTSPARPGRVVPVPGEGAPSHSPAVLDLAQQHGLTPADLQQIPGTGRDGRVTKKDVLTYLEHRKTIAVSQEGDEVIPFTPMRRAIAEHMVRSKQRSPHATAVIEVDMTVITRFREREKSAFADRWGCPLTFLPFLTQATVRAIEKYRWLNAWVHEDHIVLKREINIGVAVALPDGIIVPVLRAAETLSLPEVAQRTEDLIRRAREKRLTPTEIQGGTFTVNNLGVSGILLATPIIVQPQTAILGVGAVTRRPVVVGDIMTIRSMAYLCLSFDHRVIDGALAGGFLQAIKAELEGFHPPRQ